jgi:hypothetical protein
MTLVNKISDLNPRSRRKAGGATGSAQTPAVDPDRTLDLRRRRDQLSARMAELQWDLGGLTYEMAIRDSIRVDLLIQRAAALQDVDAELGEVERILRMEETGAAGECMTCGAPHSSGAVYCWQCGSSLLELVQTPAP